MNGIKEERQMLFISVYIMFTLLLLLLEINFTGALRSLEVKDSSYNQVRNSYKDGDLHSFSGY